MKYCIKLTSVMLAGALLAACDSGTPENDTASEPPAQETQSAMEQEAQSMQDRAMKAAEEAVAEALKIDASSLEAFRNSLSAMRANASEEEKAQLSQALTSLAQSTMSSTEGETDAGSLMDSAKKLTEKKSIEEVLYENMASRLDGKSLEDILDMAS